MRFKLTVGMHESLSWLLPMHAVRGLRTTTPEESL